MESWKLLIEYNGASLFQEFFCYSIITKRHKTTAATSLSTNMILIVWKCNSTRSTTSALNNLFETIWNASKYHQSNFCRWQTRKSFISNQIGNIVERNQATYQILRSFIPFTRESHIDYVSMFCQPRWAIGISLHTSSL